MYVKQENLVGFRYRTYNFLRVLGKGSFATVYEAFDESTCDTVAIKSISMQHFKSPKIRQLTEGQIKIMKACRNNPNIIRFIDSFKTDRSLLIVMQYCDQGSLKDYVNKRYNKRLTEDKATYFLKQILNGFKGLHQKRVIHRDFKSQNVLLHQGQAKIADLGFAKMLNHENQVARTQLGTALTMAPEVHAGSSYGLKADLWSLGVVYYQLIYGHYPYEGRDDYQIYTKSRKPPSFAGVNLSAKAKDFILKCLTFDQFARIPWSQVYSHPLITGKENIVYGLQAKALDYKQYSDFYRVNEKMEEQGNHFKPQMQKNQMTYGNKKAVKKQEEFNHIDNNKQIHDKQILAKKHVPKHSFMKQQIEFMEVQGQKLSPVKIEKLRVQNQKKKDIEATIESTKQMYLNRRNNITFMFKYIVPYVQMLVQLPVVHPNYLYILCKYAYFQLKEFRQGMEMGLNIFKVESFNEFVDSPFYKNMIETLIIDMDIAAIQAGQFHSQIINPDKDLLKQKAKFKVIAHQKWKQYVKSQAEEYQNILMTCIEQAKENKEKLIVIIEALEHFIHLGQNQSFEAFDCRLEHMNFHDAQMGINSRYEYKLSKIKF